jgi:hypothetical protein
MELDAATAQRRQHRFCRIHGGATVKAQAESSLFGIHREIIRLAGRNRHPNFASIPM